MSCPSAPSKTKSTKVSHKKKQPVDFLDPNKAPGKGLSEYEFPKVGHVFPFGTKQSNKWVQLVRFARGDDGTDNTESHDGMKLPNDTTNIGCEGSGDVADAADNTHREGGRVPTDATNSDVADAADNTHSEGGSVPMDATNSKKRKRAASGYYRTYKCPGLNCNGMFKVASKRGRDPPATVTMSLPCTCPLRVLGRDVLTETYHSCDHLIRDLFLHLNSEKAAHIVNFVKVSQDGSRNNGKKKHVSFLSSDNRLFFCTTVKTQDGLFRLIKIEEGKASISSPVETATAEEVAKATKSCTICQENATTLYRLSCTCPECEQNPYCSKCLTKLYKSRVHVAPFNLTNDDFDTKAFTYVNDKIGKCPHCQKFSVTKFVPVGSNQEEELDLPLPYGWIGDHAFMTKAEYDSAIPIFKVTIEPYFAGYNSVRSCYAAAQLTLQTAPDKQVRELKLHLLAFGDFIKFCTNRLYHHVDWVKSNEILPAETNQAPVNARTEYEKLFPDKATLLYKVLSFNAYQEIIQLNKENTQQMNSF
jgi:hypothetical protein